MRSWKLEIKTSSDDYPLYFEDEGSAQAALEEARGFMRQGSGIVTIADQLVLSAHTLVSARLVERNT